MSSLTKALSYCKEKSLVPIFLGDLFDSRMETSDSAGVYSVVKESQETLGSVVLRSNHQNKFERYAKGNKVRVEGEFHRTLEDFNSAGVKVQEVAEWLNTFPYGVVFKDSKGTEYRCCHAMFPSWIAIPSYQGMYKVTTVSSKARDYMLYGPRRSGAIYPQEETRVFWWEEPSERNWVRVAGHYHTVYISDKSLVLDGQMGGSYNPDVDPSHVYLCLWDVESQHLETFTN